MNVNHNINKKMGTRGTITLIFRGKTVRQYNHFDSYPSGLGNNLVMQIKELLSVMSFDDLVNKLDGLCVVDDGITPTREDMVRLSKRVDPDVYLPSANNWYWLPRECQGNILNIIKSGYTLDYGNGKEGCDYVLDFEKDQFYMEHRSRRFKLSDIPDNWICQLD